MTDSSCCACGFPCRIWCWSDIKRKCYTDEQAFADQALFLTHLTQSSYSASERDNGVNSFARSLWLSVLRTQKQNLQDCMCPKDTGRNAPSEGVHSVE